MEWLCDPLHNFYWTKGKKIRGQSKKGLSYDLWVALGGNRRGRFLVFTEEKGKMVRRIFLPEGMEAGG